MELTELLEDLLNVVAMVGQVPGVNKDVVDIDYHKVYIVHEFLEYSWKGHTASQDIHSGRKE